jgi:hypothetical protein
MAVNALFEDARELTLNLAYVMYCMPSDDKGFSILNVRLVSGDTLKIRGMENIDKFKSQYAEYVKEMTDCQLAQKSLLERMKTLIEDHTFEEVYE